MSGAPRPDVERLVDHLFRRQSGRLVALLTRIFGPEHLGLAEDVAQEALIKALEVWPFRGVPENPTAWLAQVAKNRALNVLKRERRFADKAAQVLDALGLEGASAAPAEAPHADAEVDEVVRLMFMACHPELAADTRVALTLKTVAGLGVEQVARALLAQPTAVAQRLVRAKRQIRELGLPLEIPGPADLPARLDSVLEVVYLLFNEGYSAHDGDDPARVELCEEALRLGRLLCECPASNSPQTQALMALMLLQAARLPGRLDAGGELLPLELQDRARWVRARIAEGLGHLSRSAGGGRATRYHLEAGIAACHAVAASVEETDWAQVIEHYDQLFTLHPSPVTALNRAVALARREGPAAGIRALEEIETHPALQRYYPLWASLARLRAEAGDVQGAAGAYRRALECPLPAPARRLLERGLDSLSGGGAQGCRLIA